MPVAGSIAPRSVTSVRKTGDRIPTLDVARSLAYRRIGEGEEDGIPD